MWQVPKHFSSLPPLPPRLNKIVSLLLTSLAALTYLLHPVLLLALLHKIGSNKKMSRSPSDAVGTANVEHIEAPVSIRSYLICAFASFGGILFGYDSGYISGVLGMVKNGMLRR